MQIETNEKVLAMYHAVAALMDEGRDIHNLKVSDITQKAGIGKGTAYEYFRSKEELLAKAICYDFAVQFQSLEKELEEKNEDNNKQQNSICTLLERIPDHRIR